MPRIYVASLADYTHGRLHGVSVEIDEFTEIEDVQRRVDSMLAESPGVACGWFDSAEEYAIHDAEGFGDLLSEYTSLMDAVAVGRAIDAHGEAMQAWLSLREDDMSVCAATEEFDDAYLDTYADTAEWAWSDFESRHPDAHALVGSGIAGLSFDPAAYLLEEQCNGSHEFVEFPGGVAVFVGR